MNCRFNCSTFKETLTHIFYFLFCHTRFLMRVSSSFCASHTASSLPMMVMCSCSGSSGDGKMIRAPVRSRTRRILAPPLPIRNLWYSGLAWSSTEKLLTCWWDKKLNVLHRLNDSKLLISHAIMKILTVFSALFFCFKCSSHYSPSPPPTAAVVSWLSPPPLQDLG